MAKIDLRQFIIPVILDNTNEHGKTGGASYCTKDYVFLESAQSLQGLKLDDRKVFATDFAVANGVSLSTIITKYNNKRGACYCTRSAGLKINEIAGVFTDGGNMFKSANDTSHYGICPCIHLNLNMVIEAKNKNGLFKIGQVEKGEGKKKYHTIEFGEYPCHYVGDELNSILDENITRMKKTGRSFCGSFDPTTGIISKFSEKEYEGQNYILCDCFANDKYSIFEDGTPVPTEGEPRWFKVEPIEWVIKNWDDMPKEINPFGTGKAKFIDVRALEVITAGLPFNASAGIYTNLWQNSMPRAYLNSYNLAEEIKTNKSGHKTDISYNLAGNGFLEEAFEVNINEQNVSQVLLPNTFGVTIDRTPMTVKEQMKFYIENGMSFMLHGPSGVGKTRRVQEIDPNCIGITLRDGILPEEITGKTAFNEQNNTSSWIEPTWYTKLCKICNDDPEHYHVLFIDELTNTRAPEQSLAYNLILDHTIEIGRGELPKNCVVIAAGNSPEESSSANILSEPLFRRFVAHIELKPNLKEWLEWGSELKPDGKTKIHPYISFFVAHYADKLFYTKYDQDKPPKFAIDPRGWEQISDVMYKNNGVLRQKLIADKIGEENAKLFLNFAQTKIITAKDIVNGNYNLNVLPNKDSDRYALIYSLRYVDEKDVSNIRTFIYDQFGKGFLDIFDQAWANEQRELKQIIKEDNKKLFPEEEKD